MENEPKYVTRQQALSLKLAGYNLGCHMVYDEYNEIEQPFRFDESRFHYNGKYLHISAPEQHQVIEWLLDVHGIWVYAEMTGNKKFYPRYRYIDKKGQHHVGDFKDNNNDRFLMDNPQEAYSIAFDFAFKII